MNHQQEPTWVDNMTWVSWWITVILALISLLAGITWMGDHHPKELADIVIGALLGLGPVWLALRGLYKLGQRVGILMSKKIGQ